MKILFSFLMLILSSCVFSGPVRESGFLTHPKAVVIVDNELDCATKEVIFSKEDDWAENKEDKVAAGVLKLKAIAKEKGLNAISDVRLQSIDRPDGQATGLVCSESKLSLFRNYQTDKEWVKAHVKIGN